MTATKTHPLDSYYKSAAEKLVGGWSALDHDEARANVDEHERETFSFPMWGTVWKATGCDARSILKLASPLKPDNEDSALEVAKDHGLGTDVGQFYECAECGKALSGDVDEFAETKTNESGDEEYVSPCCKADVVLDDEDGLVELVTEDWRDGGDETAWLADAGWQKVAAARVLVYDLGGDEILVGVNGAGYSFYESHWIPLYKALGYSWHVSAYRQQRVHDAADKLVVAYEKLDRQKPGAAGKLLPLIGELAKWKRALRSGGKLTDEEIGG